MDNPPPYSEAIKQPKVEVNNLQGTNVPGVVSEAPRVIYMPSYGPDPQIICCPSCHARVKTRVEHKPNTTTHLMAVLLLILFWPCALYPYCTDSCQDAHHYCPNCGSFLGAYHQN
uniref:LITAF domain-containing protein n=1 Tax=Clastoptera arizonana TaxID=38151 RepID=A0A1B6CGL0_9HEMI